MAIVLPSSRRVNLKRETYHELNFQNDDSKKVPKKLATGTYKATIIKTEDYLKNLREPRIMTYLLK